MLHKCPCCETEAQIVVLSLDNFSILYLVIFYSIIKHCSVFSFIFTYCETEAQVVLISLDIFFILMK